MKRRRYVYFAALLFFWTRLQEVRHRICANGSDGRRGRGFIFLFMIVFSPSTCSQSPLPTNLSSGARSRRLNLIPQMTSRRLFLFARGRDVFTAADTVCRQLSLKPNCPKILIKVPKCFVDQLSNNFRSSPRWSVCFTGCIQELQHVSRFKPKQLDLLRKSSTLNASRSDRRRRELGNPPRRCAYSLVYRDFKVAKFTLFYLIQDYHV